AWAAAVRRDRDGLARAVEALDRLSAGPQLAEGYGADQLLQFRLVLALRRGDVARRDSLWPVAVRDLAGARSPVFAASFLVRHGWPREQARMTAEVLARGVPVGAEPFHEEAMLSALAVRGAWDSVVARLADGDSRLPRAGGEPLRYGAAGGGAWLGMRDTVEAARLRGLAAAATGPHDAADLRLRDGLLGLARGDAACAAAPARALDGSADPHGD